MHAADRTSLQSRLDQGLSALRLEVAARVRERLLDYVALLERWNQAYNLTAVREPAQMVTRHLLDSLAVAPLVQGDTLADLGSGAGLPGIPLALVAPQRMHVLVDSNGKKARFLAEAVRTLELTNVRVEHCRVEDARGQYDCITARAFASLGDMLRAGGHLLAPHGSWLALKGAHAEQEVAGLPPGFALQALQPLAVPGLGAVRQVAIIRHGRVHERAA